MATLAAGAMLLAAMGCATPPGERATPGTSPDPSPVPVAGPSAESFAESLAEPGQPAAIIDDAAFRRDPIRAFREPIYAIEGRPVVLFPTPPGDLTAWWLPPMPTLRVADADRPIGIRLVWLAADTSTPRSDALAWLGGADGLGAARWTSLPATDAATLAASAAEEQRARLGDSGLWVLLVDGLRPGDALTMPDAAGNTGPRLGVRWLAPLPAGATDLSALHPPHWSGFDRAASVRLAESLGAAWRDPLQRWRVRLLADRFAGDGSFVTPLAGDGAGDPVVDEIAAQFERLWREALGTLLERDAALAAEVFAALLPITELVPGAPLPVWRTDPAAEWALLAALLDAGGAQARVGAIARALRESRPAALGWIAQDALPVNGGFDPARARVRAAELQGRPRRATVEGGLAPPPAAEVPGLGSAALAIALDPDPDATPRPLMLRSGALSQPMPLAPRATPVVAPQFAIAGLWRAWTAEGFLGGRPAPAVLVREGRPLPTTAAILTRDAVRGRWILFIECLRDPAATRGDEIRVWFNATEPVVVDAGGVLRDASGLGDVELLAHETLGDRWSATLAFGGTRWRAAEPAPDPIRFALQRTERLGVGGVRTGTWPRPKFPGQSPDTPPSTMGLDLSAWGRALAGAESFDALRRDDQRQREPFEAWREDDPLPGPTP